MNPTVNSTVKPTAEELAALDNELSKRYIELDPKGYFIIYIDPEAGLICTKHYTNVINDKGLACDPETGKPLPTRGKVERLPDFTLTGRTAKELCIKLFEEMTPSPVSSADHAAYLGRELMRAEFALVTGGEYVQD
ncbi:MAG TPA: DUF4346 domain-containing protein [Synechococcales cyanobacterium M55_K2018_004]|nr:DUF4346 domain-containing protein [Synechococcales cyanobacterium M55_K2018_004]